VLRGRRRILIIGAGGAGKTTLARALGGATGLPVVHLDRMYWRPGWIEPPRADFEAALAPVLAAERWILDGNYSGTLAMRVRACDAIVWLDPPRTVCLAGVVERRLRRQVRPDVPPGCPEHLSWDFVEWIWTYRTRSAPKVRALLDGARADGKAVVHLRSRREAARLVEVARATG
jgi:adenylate kinase family enzyme